MKLIIDEYRIASIQWGTSHVYEQGALTLSKDAVKSFLENEACADELTLTELDLICPGTKTRVINIFDVLPAHARLGDGAVDFPGFVGPVQSVGDGHSAQLTDFSVLALSSLPSRYLKVLDKAGPGAQLSPYGSQFHVAFKAAPRDPDMKRSDYFVALKKMGLLLGGYLARIAALSPSSPPRTVEYSLQSSSNNLQSSSDSLPKAVYVCMLASLQNWDKGEPILYGNDLANMAPTILHPNEFLDGAAVAQNFNLGTDTYSFINHPIIKELYARHGKDLDFAGVVVNASHITRDQRERSAMMTCNLVKHTLKADMAIFTKVGGGIPESDVMTAMESLEKQGVSTAAVIWCQWGDGTVKDTLSAFSPAADALVSVGINDVMLRLPPQDRVIGGVSLDPLSDDPEAPPQPADQEIALRCRELCGAINQLGAANVSLAVR
ncbi:MAG: glycine/sarcosine/betaine reductase component B subunit [Peptococcaceae bacterium]|jgi:glycine reductase|nr:glycine/sarcosine/betaine reductase component B subunit [Peptococcaceae bacterium]